MIASAIAKVRVPFRPRITPAGLGRRVFEVKE